MIEIEPDLLQGVGLQTVLTGFGSSFKSSLEDSVASKSRKVERLDDFISHDRVSSRFLKTVALCVIYNSKAAMIISAIVGMGMFALQRFGLVPYCWHPQGTGMWAQTICPLVFVVVFFCWQDLRTLASMGTRTVFLDRYCIDQTDPDKKAQGILGFGGFLKDTQRVVVCWTPRYFSQLWCVYEIATWFYVKKGFDNMLVMPLSTSASLLALVAINQVIICGSHFAVSISASAAAGQLLAGATLVVVALIAAHAFRHFENDLKQLPQQVRELSVTEAGCFCCTAGHRAPGTGKPLMCDRELIYTTLQELFLMEGDDANTWQRKLGLFDKGVRSLLEKFIAQRTGLYVIHYQYSVMVSQPFLWRLFDEAIRFGTENLDAEDSGRIALEYLTVGFCQVPCCLYLCAKLASTFNERVGIPTERYKDVLVSIACGLLLAAISFSCWFPSTYILRSGGGLGRILVPAAWIFVVTPLTYRESIPRVRQCASPETPAKSRGFELEPRAKSETQERQPEDTFNALATITLDGSSSETSDQEFQPEDTFNALATITVDGSSSEASGQERPPEDTFNAVATVTLDCSTSETSCQERQPEDTFNALATITLDGSSSETSDQEFQPEDTFNALATITVDGSSSEASGQERPPEDTFNAVATVTLDCSTSETSCQERQPEDTFNTLKTTTVDCSGETSYRERQLEDTFNPLNESTVGSSSPRPLRFAL
eukprot:TRINITY_DN2329_c0_g1_i1.p1 TRINITY_DN2329_c0_g1~~TRINITY_DN2329_c0_g1_i1.p1  ORF type:complete len:714 (-),score=62.47 TRINITY_DN2329_c0_g1_i1:29-2170(-)